ncbi:MAG TPA: helix-turn-helix transcriptional regulator [Ignavibacteria bacterium]|nr:helix-turn-helix transcriptional regulator [Ignavibacteria bacterium]HMR39882.1 helix-turn-helix transcriptional regulator [Ignavibacteria bacterium]
MNKKNVVKPKLKKVKPGTSLVLKNISAGRTKKAGEQVKRVMEIESFNLGNMIREARHFKNLTQEALAQRSGTTKHYISRIENNGSDIRLKTLMRIVTGGLGGILKFSVDFDN